MDKITLEKVGPAIAAALMERAGLDDPAGMTTPESLAKGGECFRLTVGEQVAVFVLKRKGAQLWISGAGAVGTSGMTAPGLAVIESVAAHSGCARVGFHTGRPGLVKLAKKHGYRVKGFILEKDV